jgi:hypothetical protein
LNWEKSAAAYIDMLRPRSRSRSTMLNPGGGERAR